MAHDPKVALRKWPFEGPGAIEGWLRGWAIERAGYFRGAIMGWVKSGLLGVLPVLARTWRYRFNNLDTIQASASDKAGGGTGWL